MVESTLSVHPFEHMLTLASAALGASEQRNYDDVKRLLDRIRRKVRELNRALSLGDPLKRSLAAFLAELSPAYKLCLELKKSYNERKQARLHEHLFRLESLLEHASR